jgi:large subunit ribosomal protein L6
MSRIGKKSVIIPEGVYVDKKGEIICVKGKNAEISVYVLPNISVEIENNQIIVKPKKNDKQTRSNWGTMRALIQNAVYGALDNFVKQLVIEGVGYRASIDGSDLILNIGYSHPVKFHVPDGVKISVDKDVITVSGSSKEIVGSTTAKIRDFRKPEPYKGKGIRYSNEVVRRKAGKKAVSATGS